MIWVLLGASCSGAVVPKPVQQPDLADVSHRRELRGVWVATVQNLNWPSRRGLPMADQQAELTHLLDLAEDARLNAIFFQVRPEGDALYASDLEPWSRYLTGRQGEDPGWDPLAWLCENAHARGIEVHAWFNPYRAKRDVGSVAVAPHAAVTLAENVHVYGDVAWMDPGAPAVEDRAVAVIGDVALRYDVDGIHLDDYFYPYPTDQPFPDDATYAAYGGGLSRADWRRANVDRLVHRLGMLLADVRPDVRFGISPFGIYRPGQPEGVTGFDPVEGLYADPLRWSDAGWVDYLAPQLYWSTTQKGHAYGTLLDFWSERVRAHDRPVFVGHGLWQVGSGPSWTVDEIRTQVDLARADDKAEGSIWFSAAPFLTDQEGIRAVLREGIYRTPALPPAVPRGEVVVDPPVVEVVGEGVRVTHAGHMRTWCVYREQDGAFVLDRIVPAVTADIPLPPGRYAISAVAPGDWESRGVVATVR